MRKLLILLGVLVCWGAAGAAPAQNTYAPKPYLAAATLYIAADAQADVWLNGIHIGHCPHTTMQTGYKTITARPDSLCYFKSSNLLAIRLQAANRPGVNFIGAAYVFCFKLSDGRLRIISSSIANQHRSLYLPRRDMEDPEGWHETGFDDSRWAAAQSSEDMIPNTASVPGGLARFLTATSNGYKAKYPGEKQLFRRSFHLDISVNPRCLPQSTPAPSRSLWSHSVPARNSLMSITPEVLPVHRAPLAATPQLGRPRYKKSYPVLYIRRIYPTATPWVHVSLPQNVPASTAPSVSISPAVPPVYAPAAIPTMVVQDDGAIVFGISNANILVTFGDGPGWYKVEAVDGNYGHLKTIFNQRVVDDSETWLTWNGKDDAGRDVPAGRYYILCSKEGTALQKIILRRRLQ